jgi:hypothetical protein
MDARRLHSWLGALAARRKASRPIPVQTWEREYRAGDWDRLNLVSETAHYMAIIGYVAHGAANPDILDAGCRHGRLLGLLAPFGFSHDLGVDFPEPLLIARLHSVSLRRSSRWPTFKPGTLHAVCDIVIFNESLLRASARRDGRAKPSVAERQRPRRGVDVAPWRRSTNLEGCRFGSRYSCARRQTVQNRKRQVWDIKALQPTR